MNAATSTCIPAAASRSTPVERWLNITSHLDPKFGGVAKVLPELCGAIEASGEFTAPLIGFCGPEEAKSIEHTGAVAVECLPPSRLPGALGTRLGSGYKSLLREVRNASGVHIHGIWEPHGAWAVKAAREAGKPWVLSAHGMLEPWARNNKRLKKAIYSSLIERANVSGAACLIALTRAEAQNYRDYGARNPVAIVPNGVRVPAAATPALFNERFPQLARKRCVLFLGRIHPKKGLALLIDAWEQISKLEPDAQLVIAGPDCEGTRARLEKQIHLHSLNRNVTFTGMLAGEMKWSALSACELFVLPSYSEGFSVSVLEAMGMGKPVIVTKACNVPEVAHFKCGWTINTAADQLACAMLQALSMSSGPDRPGENGRALVERAYSWESIGTKMTAVYRWISGGPKPDGVELLLD